MVCVLDSRLSDPGSCTALCSWATRTKRIDLQQICNRSVLAKTDHLQTNLSSAESVFSLQQTIRPDRLQRFKTADGKQIINRSAADLFLICNFPDVEKQRYKPL